VQERSVLPRVVSVEGVDVFRDEPHWQALSEALASSGGTGGSASASGRITCLVLTYCRRPELFYGTSMIFETLRVGFPTARVVVVDNASLPARRPEIEALARAAGCHFVQIPDPEVQHHEFLERALALAARTEGFPGPLVFLDPDLCFWRSCEDFRFEGLAAGRLMRSFRCELTGSLTMPRIHTSFLWIPDPAALWNAIREIQKTHFDFEPFRPYSARIAGDWCRFDTGGNLYSALSERICRFGEEELDRYDHLFCGSHADLILHGLRRIPRDRRAELHARVKAGDLEALRGVWREEEGIPRVVSARADVPGVRTLGDAPPRAADGRRR
jgi:hypothetical protein